MSVRLCLACLCFLGLIGSAGAAEPMARGKPLDYWLLLLRESEWRVTPSADWHGELGPAATRALFALEALGPEAAPALPDLLAWYRASTTGPDDRVKAALLVKILHAIGPDARPAIPLLLSLPRQLALAARQALMRIDPGLETQLRDPPPKEEVDRLLENFRWGSDLKKFETLNALAAIAPDEARVGLPLLREYLGDPDTVPATTKEERACVATVLTRMGPSARELAPLVAYRFRKDQAPGLEVIAAALDLREALRGQSPEVRRTILRRLAPTPALKADTVALLDRLLDDGDCAAESALALLRLQSGKTERLERTLADALGSLGPLDQLRACETLRRPDGKYAATVGPVLRSLVLEGDEAVREATVEMLRRPGKESVPALVALLEDRRWWYVALEALPSLGVDAAEAVPKLIKQLAGKERGRAVRVAWALAWIDPKAARTAAPALLEDSVCDNAFIREMALLTLGKLGESRALPLLGGKLNSMTPPAETAAALYGLRILGKEAVPLLVKLLRDDDLQARAMAAWLLGEIGPPARDARPELRRLAGGREPLLAVRAARSLTRIDPAAETDGAVKTLLALLKQRDGAGREAAVALGKLAGERELVRTLARELDTAADPVLRTNLALALATLGPKTRDVLPDLMPAIRRVAAEPDEWARRQRTLLLRAIAATGPAAKGMVPDVLALWKHELMREEIDGVLAALGPPDRRSRHALEELLRDQTIGPRVVVMVKAMGPTAAAVFGPRSPLLDLLGREGLLQVDEQVLWHVEHHVWPSKEERDWGRYGNIPAEDRRLVGRTSKQIISALVGSLDSRSQNEVVSAIYVLGLCGDRAKPAIPRLVKMAKDADARTLATLAVALWELRVVGVEDADLLPILIRLTKSSDDAVQHWTVMKLGALGSVAKDAVPQLLRLLKSTDHRILSVVAEALGRIGRADKEVVDAMKELLAGDSYLARTSAWEALGRLGPPAKPRLPDLKKQVERLKRLPESAPDREEMQALALAVVRIDPSLVGEVVGNLRLTLNNDANWWSIETLGKIGPPAREALPDLVAVCRKRRSVFSREASQAIAAIGLDDQQVIRNLAVAAAEEGAAASILRALGPKAKEAVPVLLDRLEMELESVRGVGEYEPSRQVRALVDTLGAIGPEARAALPLLLKLHEQSRRPSGYLRFAHAIRNIDPEAARKAGIP